MPSFYMVDKSVLKCNIKVHLTHLEYFIKSFIKVNDRIHQKVLGIYNEDIWPYSMYNQADQLVQLPLFSFVTAREP